MADEDEEFLYGDTEMENAENNNNSKNDEAELYDLYGDDETKENEQKEESPEKILETQHDKKIEEPEAKAVTEESKAEENDKDKNSDSDSDDDLEIILEPEEEPQNETETEQVQTEQSTTNEAKETLVNIKPGQQTKSSTAPATAAFSNANQSSKTAQGGINLEGVGEYNGQPINEVNLDDFEDKPWRKPGADITDYFNYGFNEVTWRAYCAKQKMLRENKKLMGDMNMSEMNMNDFMNMGDMMTMGDVMHMGMMMPPNMMDGSMPPIPMGGMPNPMMGMPMGLPGPPPPSGSSTHQNGSNSMPRSSRNSAINPMRSSTRDISMPRHSGSGNGSSSSSNNRRSDSRERRKRSYDAYRRD